VPGDGLGGARVLPDEQPLPSGGGNPQRQFGGGDEVVFEVTEAEDKARSFANG